MEGGDDRSRDAGKDHGARLAALKAVLNHAVENEKLATNPASKVSVASKSKGAKKKMLGFDDHEARVILEAAVNDRRMAIKWVPLLCAMTGARVGEMIQLRKEADLQERLRDLLGAIPGIDVEAASDNLVLIARQAQAPEADFPDLATAEGQGVVLDKARRGEFDLVILDNFSVLANVDDENDAAAMSPVLGFLMRMKQANIATLLLHHSSKGGDNYRGSSKLATTFEVIAGLSPTLTVKRHYAAFDMTFGKFRGKANDTIDDTTAWLTKATDSPHEEAALQWQFQLSDEGQLRRLVEAVKSCRFGKQADLAKAFRVSTGKMSGMKAIALAKGLIKDSEWSGCMEAAKAAETAGLMTTDDDEEGPF